MMVPNCYAPAHSRAHTGTSARYLISTSDVATGTLCATVPSTSACRHSTED